MVVASSSYRALHSSPFDISPFTSAPDPFVSYRSAYTSCAVVFSTRTSVVLLTKSFEDTPYVVYILCYLSSIAICSPLFFTPAITYYLQTSMPMRARHACERAQFWWIACSGGRQRPRLMVLTATFPSAKARHETCQWRLYMPARPPLRALGRVCDTSPFRLTVQSKKNI